MLNWKTKSKN